MTPSVIEASPGDKRGKNFDVEEDKLLVLAWLNTSLDPVNGNAKGDRFWQRVENYYIERKKEEWQIRSRSSLNHRWGVILHAVSKFCGFLTEVEERSDTSYGDNIQEARRLYYDATKSPFRFDHCWDLLKDEDKWKKREKLTGTKRKSTGSSCTLNPEVVSLGEDDEPSKDNRNEQTIGQKDVKEKKTSFKNMLADVSGFTSALSELNNEKRKDRSEKMEKINLANKQKYELLEIKKAQLFQAQEANRIQNERLQLMYHIENEKLKLEREREDASIMMKDLSSMDPEQKEYFQKRRMEILARKSSNVNNVET